VNKIKTLKELGGIVAKARKKGKTIVLANGIFDLIHVGHVRYLRAAKSLGDLLIVAVNSDGSARVLKGPGRPIAPLKERMEILSNIRWIDYCVSFPGKSVGKVILTLKPDIHAKGTDYTRDTVPEREAVRSYGGRIAIVGDLKRHSTSALIQRIKETHSITIPLPLRERPRGPLPRSLQGEVRG